MLYLSKYFILSVIIFTSNIVYSQINYSGKDTSEVYGGIAYLGFNIFCQDPTPSSDFRFFVSYSVDKDINEYFEHGLAIDPLNYRKIKYDFVSPVYGDKVKDYYYSILSIDFKYFVRFILNGHSYTKRLNDYNWHYFKKKMFADIGFGYNLPLWFDEYYTVNMKEVKKSVSINHNDLYCYFLFHFLDAFAVKIEYHPFNLIENVSLQNIPKVNICFQFGLVDFMP